MNINDKESGTTLISLLIASAMLVILSTYVASVLFDMGQFDLRDRARRLTVSTGRYVMTEMRQDIRAADSIQSPEAGQTDNRFTIRVKGQDISYYLEGDKLIRNENGEADAVTSNQVKITNFQVSHLVDQQEPNLPTLQISISIDWIGHLRPGQSPQYDLDTTVSLRR